MKANQLSELCGLKEVVLKNPESEIKTLYCCDLLSIVMGRAPQNAAWVTIMGNVNSVAVASLAEISAIILADGVKPDENAVKKAEENGINILLSDEPIFETALKIHKVLD